MYSTESGALRKVNSRSQEALDFYPRKNSYSVVAMRDRYPGPLRICATALWLVPMAMAGNDSNAPAQHRRFQTITPGPPPKSPAIFNPDPSKLVLPTNVTSTNWSRRIFIQTNSPPAKPSEFNPDPGAFLRQSPPDAPNLFPSDPILGPAFKAPEIPSSLELPRTNVRENEVQPPIGPAPGNFNSEPLPNAQALPREKTRQNLKVTLPLETSEPNLRAADYPTNTQPRPDRWRIGFTPWKRYTSGVTEQPYENPEPMLWHPYRQSILKGDVPVIGQDIFLDLTASTQTEVEFRRVPTASGVSAAVPGAYEFFGQS